jgi:hypothetical protein
MPLKSAAADQLSAETIETKSFTNNDSTPTPPGSKLIVYCPAEMRAGLLRLRVAGLSEDDHALRQVSKPKLRQQPGHLSRLPAFTRDDYFAAELISLNTVLICLPVFVSMAINATAISEVIKPYSIAVAARSSRQKFMNSARMFVPRISIVSRRRRRTPPTFLVHYEPIPRINS